ncbi:alpha/beta hydrolase [Burkholderia sp. Ac-20353]|uniref:alpha/beta fold hydrolase n=1 Tax=Burkholderia sp. Ac-20353 TaxID=2703894 RepID=UPI00197B3D38|nr:alpha/beta hydrolase [Burkholderia sp. Ac-20353]MBN3790398.1 alpha/beta hydrolase [Burkholderia sp. Ac-20353]
MNRPDSPLQHPAGGLGYVQHGTGHDCVMVLHDWLGDHTNYDPLLPYLDTTTFTYVFADLRGYGKSRHLTGDYTVDEIAADCVALADRLGWQRFHVIGHSMTGMVTQRVAADAPSRIKSAIAVCPVSAAGNRLSDDARAFFASTIGDDDAFRRLVRFVTGGLSAQWADFKRRQNRENVARECQLAYLDMLVDTDFVDAVRGLDTRFLVIVGDKDPGLGADAMKETFLAWHPNAQLRAIPNCGHYPMQEQPPHFATIIEDFLRNGTA